MLRIATRGKARTGELTTQLGFTLIEIIIALAIVSISVVAIMDAMGKNAQTTGELEQRILASWVASNKLAELRYDAKINRIKTGSKSETVKMGGLSWRVKSQVKKTEVERVYLVTVDVKDEKQRDKNPYSVMTTAITDPQ